MASVMTTGSTTHTTAVTTALIGAHPTVRPVDRRELDDIASTVETSGVAAVDPRYLATLLDQARVAGVCPTLLEVLVGAGEPAVARTRAFGRIAATLVSRAV